MEKGCETCRFSIMNNGTRMTCGEYRKSVGVDAAMCSYPDFSQWQPKEEPMEERLKAIVARVRAIYPDAGYIQLYPTLHDYSHIEGLSVDYSLYVADLIMHKPFPTIEALELFVTELEEKHRKENMTDVEKIREYVELSDDPHSHNYLSVKDMLSFIDSLSKPKEPF